MRYLSILFALSVVFLASGRVCAELEQKTTDNKAFVIGVENIHYLPHYNYDGIHFTGFARDFFDAFAKASGYRFDYKAMPTNRLYSNLEAGRIDFKYPDNAQWFAEERAGKPYAYSSEVAPFTDGVMVVPENKGKGKNALRRLGSIQGFQPWGYRDAIASGEVTLVEERGFVRLLRSAVEGNVDGAFMNVDVAKHQVTHILEMPGAIVFDPELPYSKGSYHLSTLKHPEVIKQLNRYIAENQPFIQQLKREHGLLDD
jgi:hypothetical protein